MLSFRVQDQLAPLGSATNGRPSTFIRVCFRSLENIGYVHIYVVTTIIIAAYGNITRRQFRSSYHG